MSSKAMTFAWASISMVRGSTHHLLLAICENVPHETGLAFPSIAGLMEMTGQDRKTVIAGIDRILGAKLMKDTGTRTGRTRQIPVYQLAPWVKDWSVSETMGKTGLFDFPGNSTDSPSEESRFSGEESQKRDTDPSIGPKDGILPPTPDGVGTPKQDLFNGALPEAIPQPLEDFVTEQWALLKAEHPGVASLQILSPARITKIRARAGDVVKALHRKKIETTPEEVWRRVFDGIRRSVFLCGRAPPGRGRTTPFKLTIDFVLRQAEFFKIWDGGHDDDEQRFGPGRSYDAASGRDYGPAESAARRAVGRLHVAEQRRAGGRSP